jgi:hypothetical protein
MNVVVVVVVGGGGRGGGGRRRGQHTTTVQVVAGQRPGGSVHTVFTALVLIVVVLLGLIIVIVFVFASVNFSFTNIMLYSRALLTATVLFWSLNPTNKHFGADPTVKQFFAQYFFHGLERRAQRKQDTKIPRKKNKGERKNVVRNKFDCQWFNIRDGFQQIAYQV